MKLRREKKPLPLVPIASMGDIAFLLIIFFVLTTNFIKEAHIELETARAPEIEELKESSVSVSVDRDGAIWLQGTGVSADMLEAEVSALLEGKEKKLVMLKVDRDLPQSVFGPVIMALSNAEAEIAMVGEELK